MKVNYELYVELLEAELMRTRGVVAKRGEIIKKYEELMSEKKPEIQADRISTSRPITGATSVRVSSPRENYTEQ